MKCLSVILAPAGLLQQPAGWFHQVYAPDSPNMSVSYYRSNNMFAAVSFGGGNALRTLRGGEERK